jgi:ferredoxin-fold anticodon binding domain-containing protein
MTVFTPLQNRLKKLLKVNLFDVYEGSNLPDGKKSYALSFIIQDHSKTLTDTQIDKIMSKLQKNLKLNWSFSKINSSIFIRKSPILDFRIGLFYKKVL